MEAWGCSWRGKSSWLGFCQCPVLVLHDARSLGILDKQCWQLTDPAHDTKLVSVFRRATIAELLTFEELSQYFHLVSLPLNSALGALVYPRRLTLTTLLGPCSLQSLPAKS